MSFGLIAKAIFLTEVADQEKARILQKVQHKLMHQYSIDASLRALYDFFVGMDPYAGSASSRLPVEDEREFLQDMVAHGYDLHGGYAENTKFWNGVLTPQEYSIITSHPARSEENEEEADGWRTNIRHRAHDLVTQRFQRDQEGEEYEEDTEAFEPESHPLYPDLDKTKDLPPEIRRDDPKFNEVPYASLEQEEQAVTPHDYQKWMRVMHEEGAARGININNKRSFEDLAFEMLDNDPKMDSIGSDERTKSNIVNILWQQHRAMIAQQKAQQSFKSMMRPEENEEYEEVSGAFQQAQDACLDHWRGTVKGTPKNPYAKGTKRHADWEKGWEAAEHGVWDKRHVSASEDEESEFGQHFRMSQGLPPSYENEEAISPLVKLKPVQRMFKLIWKNGREETISGNDIADAFSKAGYGARAIASLDHYQEVYNQTGKVQRPAPLGRNVDTMA